MRWLLLPFAWLYGLVTGLRNLFFSNGWLRSFSFDFPIILVGNLSAGGTGKTPHIEYLIRLLKSDHKVATLSRGYKRTYTGFGIATELSRVEDIGDEPKQYKQKFPDVEVAVSIDRVMGVYQLLEDEPATQVILMDDGFQHRRIKAGLNILLTTWQKPFTRDQLIPVGRLRESRSGKRRAQVIIVTKCPADISAGQRQDMISELHLTSEQQVFFTTLTYGNVYPLFNTGQQMPVNARPLVVTGIAGNKAMLEHLRITYPQLERMSYADHHYFTAADIKNMQQRAGESKCIITTEKDAMRLMEQEEAITAAGLQVFVLPVEVTFIADGDKFDTMVKDYIRNNTPTVVETGE